MRRLAVLAVAAGVLALLVVACGSDEEEESSGGTPTDGDAVSFADECKKSDEKQFSTPPDMMIDTGKTYLATITTARGDIVVELFSDVPVTTNNFVFLACKGFYDGLTFHRVVPDFVIQGGAGPGYTIPDEDDGDHLMETGVISMARTQFPDSAGGQFFITIGPRENLEHLDADFAVFGRVTEGMDVAQQIAVGDQIETIKIEER